MKDKKKQILLSILGILSLVLITVGVTYAVFTYTKLGSTENTITTGTLKFLYTENAGSGAGINLTNAFPVSDAVGKTYSTDGQVFDFSVEATNATNDTIPYEVTLRKKSTSTLDENVIKVYLTDITEETDSEILAPTLYSELTETSIDVGTEIEKTIYNGTVNSNNTTYLKKFRLRMWMDENTNFSATGTDEEGNPIYPYNGKSFIATVNVYANVEVVTNPETTVYKEELLNGADPVLKSSNTTAMSEGINRVASTGTTELVPVIIGSNGTVTKANINEKWYNYANKEWANAVILKDETIVYNNGDTIPESNIESYFVWIPKYSYQIFDLGEYTELTSITNKEQPINIRFGLINTDDANEGECTTPTTAGSKGNCSVGDYMTHPAFLAFDSNGMWVGKFETGYDGATDTSSAQVNSVDTSKIIVKPNVYSWRNITVGNSFKNSYDYIRNLDSHMMKNTEWGAVDYLQHSSYGSLTSVRLNNNSAYITGYSATEEPTKGNNGGTSTVGNRVESTAIGDDGTYTINYLNPNSVVTSTTGNYSGIYDMSGGAWEYVMGYTTGASTIGGASGITSLYNDFFNDSAYTKYWDKYTSTTKTQYNYRILGDATGEMGPFFSEIDLSETIMDKSSWYGDYGFFANAGSPWFFRGGHFNHGTSSGVFAFSNHAGGENIGFSFRIVLTPTK